MFIAYFVKQLCRFDSFFNLSISCLFQVDIIILIIRNYIEGVMNMGETVKADLMEIGEGLVETLNNISDEEIKKHQEYKDYIKALERINALSDELYKEDKELGFPLMTMEKKKEVLEAYKNCDKAIKSLKEKLNREYQGKNDLARAVVDICNNVTSYVTKDVATISAYDPSKEKKTMPELIKSARAYTFDITGEKLNTVGGALSSRITLNYTKPDGTQVKGVFTKKTYIDGEGGMVAALGKICNGKDSKDKKYRALLREYFDAIKEENPELKDKAIAYQLIQKGYYKVDGKVLWSLGGVRDSIKNEIKYYRESKGKSTRNLTNDVEELVNSRLVNDEAFSKAAKTLSISTCQYEAYQGDRIDSRNSAMSVVAGLLGKSELVAKAMPAFIKVGDEKVEGTFMEYVGGDDVVDPTNLTDADKTLKPNSVNGSEGLRSVADLQVLDYICGNIDRHAGNIMCVVDREKQTVKRVIGIDNDASMGSYIPESRNSGRNLLAPLNYLGAISQSMADAVLALDDDVLKLALREYDLKPVEIDACCKRLNMVKDFVKDLMNPKKNATMSVRLVEDKYFKGCSITGFAKAYVDDYGASHRNMFSILANEYFDKKEMDSVGPYKERVFTEAYDKDIKVSTKSVEKHLQYATKMCKLLASKTTKRRTSDNYIAVENACAEYKGLLTQLVANKEMLDINNISKVNDCFEKIIKVADVYLSGKGRLTGRKSYTQNRIEAVQKIKNFAMKNMITSVSKKDMDALLEAKNSKPAAEKTANRRL